MKTVGVLALQGDVREHLAALRRCGVKAMPVRRPSELDDVDALVLPGGESTTMSRLLESFELLDPVRKRLADGMPAYGSCAGMILLSRDVLDGRPDQRQLGGLDVVVRRNAFGRQVDSFEADVDLAGVGGGPVRAVFIRAPWVESVGEGVRVLATLPAASLSAASPAATLSTTSPAASLSTTSVPRQPGAEATEGRIVAVRQGMVLATAFHPELTGDGRVHRLFCDLVRGGEREFPAAG